MKSVMASKTKQHTEWYDVIVRLPTLEEIMTDVEQKHKNVNTDFDNSDEDEETKIDNKYKKIKKELKEKIKEKKEQMKKQIKERHTKLKDELKQMIDEEKRNLNQTRATKKRQNKSDLDIGVLTHIDGETNPKKKNEITPQFISTVDGNKLEEKRGLVLICCHSNFKTKKYDLLPRTAADSDMSKMKERWCQYGCDILQYMDEGNDFYQNKIVNEIKERLKSLEKLEFITLIISTHGEEKEEHTIDGKAYFQHYFYSNDGIIQTQKLIDDIAKIDLLTEKIKMFIIEACRCRANPNTESYNIDKGVEIPISNTIPTTSFNGTSTDHRNQKINMKDTESRGETYSNASGVMPMHTKNTIDTDIPTTVIPHYDNCIVMFGSMTGKYAYEVENASNKGSWLIDALYDVLEESDMHNGKLDMLYVLTQTNKKVAENDADYKKFIDGEYIPSVKAQSCFFHNITEEFFLVRN